MRSLTREELRRAGLDYAAVLEEGAARRFLVKELPPFGGVIAALFPYYTGKEPGNLSLYARGRDYHLIVRARLERAAAALGLEEAMVFADVSPFREVALAAAGGLGQAGKNGLLVNRPLGSFFFIGELVTKEQLAPLSGGLEGACTGCGLCTAACPTAALQEENLLVGRCLSHITQSRTIDGEQRAALEKTSLIWGCDACQLCCPANQGLGVTALPEFQTGLQSSLTGEELAGLSEREFRRRFAGRAFTWRGVAPLKRNLALKEREQEEKCKAAPEEDGKEPPQ
ncbi:MAG: DUF1730 domain-containing protein [Clostridia bacterium]|nr:DUF1730 domain-containing protein [Clostridia bacterium]